MHDVGSGFREDFFGSQRGKRGSSSRGTVGSQPGRSFHAGERGGCVVCDGLERRAFTF